MTITASNQYHALLSQFIVYIGKIGASCTPDELFSSTGQQGIAARNYISMSIYIYIYIYVDIYIYICRYIYIYIYIYIYVDIYVDIYMSPARYSFIHLGELEQC